MDQCAETGFWKVLESEPCMAYVGSSFKETEEYHGMFLLQTGTLEGQGTHMTRFCVPSNPLGENKVWDQELLWNEGIKGGEVE